MPQNTIAVLKPFSRPNSNKRIRRCFSRENSLVLEFMEEPTKSSIIEVAAIEDEADSKGDEAMKSSRGDSVTQRSIEIYIDAQE